MLQVCQGKTSAPVAVHISYKLMKIGDLLQSKWEWSAMPVLTVPHAADAGKASDANRN